MTSRDVEIAMGEGSARAYVCEPAGGPKGAVLMCMDALGFRSTLREMGEAFAAEGWLVLIPDLFWRSAPYGPFDPALVFSDMEALKVVGRLNKALSGVFAEDAPKYVDYLAGLAGGGRIAVMGYCMGGRCALTVAGLAGDRVALAMSFHGGELATTRDTSPHLLAGAMTARVYVGVAEVDPYFTGEEEGRLAGALRDANVDHIIETYRGAHHGFAVRDTPAFNAQAAARHQRRALSLLAEMVE
jgi:carboxymethylenebutenolidase